MATKKKIKANVYCVAAYADGKWQMVSHPLPRAQAAIILAAQWKLGRLARLIAPQMKKAA